MAQDITSWGEMKQVLRELKKPEVKAMFKAVIVDTIDIASELCTKYICNQLGVDSLGEVGYGKGWTAFKQEFNDVFRTLTQLGYAVFFIGHHKEVQIEDGDGKTHIEIRPNLSNSVRTIIEGMADIYGYAHQEAGADMSVLTLRHKDDTIACGGRFKYIKAEFPMSYDNLVAELKAAIEKEAAETNGKFLTDEPIKPIKVATYDYEALMAEFQNVVGSLMTKSPEYGKQITFVVDKYLGKGKKVSETTPDQAELIFLIVKEIKEDILSKVK